MIRSKATAFPGWLTTLVVGVTAAALVVAATFVMFSAFMIYDDEGYVLLSLRNFAEHGGLYRDVYTQYGPFPFVFYYVLQELGIPLTHTIGRLITIGAWAGTALWCAALAGYATRSLIARLAVLAAIFLYLWIMSSEPTHPGGIIVLLIATLAALGYHWVYVGRLSRLAVMAGAVAAALLLTKINIGVFVVFSTVTWCLLHHQNDAIRRWAPALAIASGMLLPVALMRPLLGTPWVQIYVLVFACSSVAVSLATSIGATGHVGWRTFIIGLLAGGFVAAVILGVVLFRGTRPQDLLEGLVFGPLHQPTNFSLRFKWPAGIGPIAVGSVVACAIACVLRRRLIASVDVAIAWSRLSLALALAVTLARFPSISPDYLVFGFALPCIWIYVWPLRSEEVAHTRARAWVALLLLGQCLHVFPVPGSQIAWGSFLVIPVAAIGAWDASKWLAQQRAESCLASPAATIASRLLVIGFAVATGWKFGQLATRFRGGQYVGLPGAELIRVPERPAALLRVLTANAAAHADVLFSLPGMFSFNLWSALPTPTLANVTHWFSLFDASRQQAIADALKAHPRACVIIDRAHVVYLTQRGLAPRGLLYDYIMQNFEPAFAVGHFDFLVHRGRVIAPFMIADLLVRPTPGDDKSATDNTLLKFSLPVSPPHAISRIELLPDDETTTPIVLHVRNSRVEVGPMGSRGQPAEHARPATWPISISGPSTLLIYYHSDRGVSDIRPATLILRDETGAEIGLARLRL